MIINIRRSRPDEGEKIIRIWCRSVDATHDFLSTSYRTELEKLVSAFLPDAPLWVAVTEQDEPVAFMLLTEQHMDALFVNPDVHGRGIGKRLIQHAFTLVSQLTTKVNEQNQQAVGFYKKMGFHITGRSETDDLGQPYPLLILSKMKSEDYEKIK